MNNTSSVFYPPGGMELDRLWREAFEMKPKAPPRHFIAQWRRHRGLNQERLAERIGKTQPTISRLETGETPYDQGLLEAIADALSCSPADLLMRDPGQTSAIWSIWDQLKPAARQQAIRVLQALADDKAA